MSEVEVTCPKCGSQFELTEALKETLTAPLIDTERRKLAADFERQLGAQRKAIADEAAGNVALHLPLSSSRPKTRWPTRT